MAKTLRQFETEGTGWVVRVTAGGKEFLYRGAHAHRTMNRSESSYAIRFSAPFDITPDSDIATVSIYNLAKESVDKFKRGESLKIEGGYEPNKDHLEHVLTGTIEDVIVEEKVKYKRLTTIQVSDAGDKWPIVNVGKAWMPGVMTKTVAKDLIQELGLTVGKIDPAYNYEYHKGLSICGPIRPELEMVVRDMKSKLHITRGKVYILEPNEGIPTGLTISGDNGLLAMKPAIAVPGTLEYISTWTDDEKPIVYELQMLLTPRLTADSIFTLESEDVSGQFRVISGSHFCDGRAMLTKVRVAKV